VEFLAAVDTPLLGEFGGIGFITRS